MDCPDCCAASAEFQACKAEVLEGAEKYTRMQMARIVLLGGVDQYREKTQGDMLKRAGELFALLSGGSFSALKLGWDKAGNLVLVGVRAQLEGHVGLQSMSDRTRDQLYLALRLAIVGLYSKDHEPIPFILDDILVSPKGTTPDANQLAVSEIECQIGTSTNPT